jgi:Transaldolase
MVDGVTTNPSLIAKEKRGFDSVVREILDIVEGPVSLEVVSLEAKGMFAEVKNWPAWASRLLLKCP